MSRMPARLCLLVAWLTGLLLPVPRAQAQQPSISTASPQAVAPGQTTDMTLTGGNLAGATAFWSSFPAEHSLTPDVENNGQDNAKIVYRLVVPETAGIGVHAIRVANDKGVSAPRLVMVDDLPSLARTGGNTSLAAAQEVSLPVAIDGAVEALTRHYFRFTVEAGQRVSFEVVARRLGSPLDPMIRVLDSAGRELTYSDDAPGLNGDSQLSHTFADAGQYVVELRDIRYQGGGGHLYRLRIGDFPCVSVPYPMAVQRGQTVNLEFAGQDIEELAPVAVTIPADATTDWTNVAARRAGGNSSGFAILETSADAQASEQEPNDEVANATRVELGQDLNGRLQAEGDRDRFVFTAKKGQQFIFDARTRSQGAATDTILRLLKADGGQLAENDDAGSEDARLVHTFPEDGDYILQVADLHGRGGPLFTYHVDVQPQAAAFTLTASAHTLNVPAGGTALMTVTTARNNYNGPIELTVAGLPDGLSAVPTVIGPGRNSVVMTLVARADAPTTVVNPVQLIGTGSAGDQQLTATCDILGPLKASTNNLPWPPLTLAEAVAVGTAPAAPISLKTDPPQVVFGQHLKTRFKVIVNRTGDYNEQVELKITPEKDGIPAGIALALKPIPANQNEIELEISADEKAPLGDFSVVLNGILKKGKTTVTQPVPGLRLQLAAAFGIRAEPAAIELSQGQQVKLKASLQRNPAFAEAVTVVVENLPKGVTAEPATIAAGANEVELTLTAAADAAQGSVANVQLKGTGKVGDKELSATSSPVNLTVK